MEENSKSPPQWWIEEPPDETPVELYKIWAAEMYEDPNPIYQSVGRKIKLANGKQITLNQQQNEALDLAALWIVDRSELFYTLSGYAGTGKSTIAKEVIKEFRNKINGNVAACAPTHKAKKVIALFTGLEAETIQSLLGLAPNVELADFDINKPEFAPKRKPTIESYRMIVVDEASMINKSLWEMLKTQARRFNTRLFLMGDRGQLPPIKEDLSPIFTDPDITYKFELTTVERQSNGNPLMLIYDKIRDNLTTEHDQFHHADDTNIIFRPDQLGSNDPRNPQVEVGYRFHNTLNKFGQDVISAYRGEEIQLDPSYCKVLCWTNAQVEFWNQSIRKTLMSDLAKNPKTTQEILLHAGVLMPNELLMGYQTYNESIQNAGEYEVISMQYDDKKVWYGDKKQYSADIAGYRVAMRDIDQDTILNTFIVDPEQQNITTFTKVFNSYLFLAKTMKQWPAYYAFKGQHLLMKNIYDVSNHLVVKKDLDYAYSLSIHRSQGSTYDQVFVDMQDINKNKNIIERNKLKYVAFSRPRYLATIFTGGTS